MFSDWERCLLRSGAEINDDNMVKSRDPWTPRSVNCVFTQLRDLFVSRESDNDNGGLWLVSHRPTLASDWLMGVISSPGWIWVIFCLLGRGWGLVLNIITLTYHRFYISSSHLCFSWKYKSLICCAKSCLVLLAVIDPWCYGPIRLRSRVWGVSERRVRRRVNANFKQNVIIILYLLIFYIEEGL